MGGIMGVGALIGYGTQVYNNFQNGLTGFSAFSTNIQLEPIWKGAVIAGGVALAGTAVVTAISSFGSTIGALSGVACADGDCSNEVESAKNTVSQISDDLIQVPAKTIRFTQDSISPNTKSGVPLDILTDEISNGFFTGYIRVTQFGDKLYSLDNRRLAAFKLLDLEVPVKFIEFSEVAFEFSKKFTTVTNGLSLIIRGTNIKIE